MFNIYLFSTLLSFESRNKSNTIWDFALYILSRINRRNIVIWFSRFFVLPRRINWKLMGIWSDFFNRKVYRKKNGQPGRFPGFNTFHQSLFSRVAAKNRANLVAQRKIPCQTIHCCIQPTSKQMKIYTIIITSEESPSIII